MIKDPIHYLISFIVLILQLKCILNKKMLILGKFDSNSRVLSIIYDFDQISDKRKILTMQYLEFIYHSQLAYSNNMVVISFIIRDYTVGIFNKKSKT